MKNLEEIIVIGSHELSKMISKLSQFVHTIMCKREFLNTKEAESFTSHGLFWGEISLQILALRTFSLIFTMLSNMFIKKDFTLSLRWISIST